MAHAKISLTLFSSLITAFYLTKLSVQYEGWSMHELRCSGYVEKAEDCWLEHSDVPSCDGDDELVKCAEDVKNSARHCKDEIKDPINEKYEMYKTIHNTLCENKELRDEFEKKIPCWHTARTCVSSLASMSGDSEEADEDECSKLLDAVESCNSNSGRCLDIQTNFTFEIFEASSCVAHVEKLMGDGNAGSIVICNLIYTLVVTTIVATANW